MESQSNVVAAAGGAAGANSVLQSREDWRLARKAHEDLQLAGMPSTNLLLVGTAAATRIVLEMLWLELREPVLRWRPGQQLELPPPGRAATLVLHDVNELTKDDQHRVLRWLDEAAGRIRVVSTTAVALFPRVKTGTFDDRLYYRLNTVSVNLAVKKN
jgi:hypothetical protein